MLRYLRILSNIDKHRNLNVVVVRVNVHDTFTIPGGMSATAIRPMLN